MKLCSFILRFSFRHLVPFCLVVSLLIACSENPVPVTATPTGINDMEVDYFIAALQVEVKKVASRADTVGREGGMDGFTLRKTFSYLIPQDFTGVLARQGQYAVYKGELSFTGNAASTSAVLTTAGYKTLLQNLSRRLGILVGSRRDVNRILSILRGPAQPAKGARDSPDVLLDAVYLKYIPQNLIAYMKQKYPAWSLPGRYRWHPKLFEKYRTKSSVAPVISGDFDCDGKRDYALLMDKRKKGLALVLFLGREDTFFAQVLTENLVHEVPKIEYVLTLVQPGVYPTIDPDRDAEGMSVRLPCASIGIGLFKELYDRGRDVYYFSNGALRSTLIEDE